LFSGLRSNVFRVNLKAGVQTQPSTSFSGGTEDAVFVGVLRNIGVADVVEGGCVARLGMPPTAPLPQPKERMKDANEGKMM
jgi:hypothetical protein